jgi:hypothetical protein
MARHDDGKVIYSIWKSSELFFCDRFHLPILQTPWSLSVGLRKEISNVGGGFYFAWWVGVIPCLNVLGMTALQNIAKESVAVLS